MCVCLFFFFFGGGGAGVDLQVIIYYYHRSVIYIIYSKSYISSCTFSFKINDKLTTTKILQ